MTFTYSGDLTQNIDFVRFYTGDTTNGENFLTDEVITSLVATRNTREDAVIAGIQYIIRQLSKPNFQADWLRVTYHEARAGYEKMLDDLRQDFGLVQRVTARAGATYRADGRQAESPTFDHQGVLDDDECLPGW